MSGLSSKKVLSFYHDVEQKVYMFNIQYSYHREILNLALDFENIYKQFYQRAFRISIWSLLTI